MRIAAAISNSLRRRMRAAPERMISAARSRFAADSLLEETGFEPSVPQPRFEDAVITVLTARRFFADIGAARQARRFIAAYRIGLADCAPQDYARPEQESDLFFSGRMPMTARISSYRPGLVDL